MMLRLKRANCHAVFIKAGQNRELLNMEMIMGQPCNSVLILSNIYTAASF